jgi:hypothetical protein
MTTSSAVSESNRAQVVRRNWAGEPNVVLGEDADSYNALLTQVSRVLAPRDVLEDMWMRDVVDLAWDVLRLRRLKAHLLKLRARDGVRDVISPLVRNAWRVSDKWTAGNAAALDTVDAALKSAGLSIDTVMAATLRNEIDYVERIDALIASAENRRSLALLEIERYRSNFADELRQALPDMASSAGSAAALVPQLPAAQERP